MNKNGNIHDELEAEVDLSEAHYQLLSSAFEELSDNIQSEIQQGLREERDYRLSRYNQNLLMPIPKHLLVKAKHSLKKFAVDIDVAQQYQVEDVSEKKRFNYTTQSQVVLSAFDVKNVDLASGRLMVELSAGRAVVMDAYSFDLWLNPELWGKLNYRLLRFKRLLFKSPHCKVKLSYDNGVSEYCNARIEEIQYTLGLNDRVRLRLISPEFDLGFKVVFEDIPTEYESTVVEMECLFDVSSFRQTELFDVTSTKEPLFATNIVPLFNLYESYSSAQKLDEKYDKIPLLNPEDPNAKAISVKQVWVNNNLYKEYYNHTVSEYVFHKHVGKLTYYPKNLTESLKQSKKVFAKVLWTQNISHGNFLRVSSNALAASNIRYDLISSKSEIGINSFRYINRVVQIFRTFSDLDIREQDGFLIALKFLCGEEYVDLYRRFKLAIDRIQYNRVANELNIYIKQAGNLAFVGHVAEIVSEFFYVNSPQSIEIKMCVNC